MQVEEADRIIACSPAAVTSYFTAYGPLLAKFGPGRVYNMDESPILMLGRWLKGVVAPSTKGDVKRVGGTSKAIMREMFSIITCFSASGHLIPHAFIVKGATRKSNPLKYTQKTMPGATFICKKMSAMIDGTLLEMWLDHFVRRVPGGVSPDNPVLLLLDSHSSRTMPGVIAKAKLLGVDILLPPGNTTSELQPCDQIFGGFKARLATLRVMLLQTKGFTGLTEQAIFRLIGEASQASFTREAMSRAFGHCGLYPLDLEKVLKRLPSNEQRVAAEKETAAAVAAAAAAAGPSGAAATEAAAAVAAAEAEAEAEADTEESSEASSSDGEEGSGEDLAQEAGAGAAGGLDVLAAAAVAAATAAAKAAAAGARAGTLQEQRAAILQVPPLPQPRSGPSKRITVERFITSEAFAEQQEQATAAQAATKAAKTAAEVLRKVKAAARLTAAAQAKGLTRPQLIARNAELLAALDTMVAAYTEKGLELPHGVADLRAAGAAPAAAAAAAEPDGAAAGESDTSAVGTAAGSALEPTQPASGAGRPGATVAAAKRAASARKTDASVKRRPPAQDPPPAAVQRPRRSTRSSRCLKDVSDDENA
ncbi:hypothetical protein HYH02_003084 [Chlamydomonas schloesseri]|uniref:DDE-1 domain-containing protein n=1 Tax=Chlamydomonas schloesseri TaxID=2026947 RepID=A0A836BA10_9CHLO|nr:hypothetical protein HYH02_003084 [Chlamydomonas schloesseri]|eukprot:KAG2452048.1 hypothetical protein HYH02_003084 [Chlamydomonas schloesseri]